MSGAAIVLYAQLPVHGHYFWNLFPAFLLSGLGLAFAFVPMSIGALAGVRQSEAGVASGLINTSQQIGGAIGVAVATTIATTFTAHYVNAHPGSSPLGGGRTDARLHDRVLLTRGNRSRGRARGGSADGVGSAGSRRGAGGLAGGSVNAVEYDRGTHEITDVLTQLKGLVLVQPILEAERCEQRGARAAHERDRSCPRAPRGARPKLRRRCRNRRRRLSGAGSAARPRSSSRRR